MSYVNLDEEKLKAKLTEQDERIQLVESQLALETPESIIHRNVERIKLFDVARQADLNKERRVLFEAHGGHVVVAVFGCGSVTYAPYFDVVIELAYDTLSKNLNCVITNKGDNAVEVSVDDKLVATTEQVSGGIGYHDEVATVKKKWLSFNFRDLT